MAFFANPSGDMLLSSKQPSPHAPALSVWLHNVDIAPHATTARYFQHEAKAKRRLLLHKAEIRKLETYLNRILRQYSSSLSDPLFDASVLTYLACPTLLRRRHRGQGPRRPAAAPRAAGAGRVPAVRREE